ncbi:MFS transporter [Galactobacter caseinivorans]|uniref:MFS transporter n=1 Tax=Galactobacter caseinivorans TaxID=2676123 RepID=A0A496PI60_9MICC|nr:MFS transporter [Galactobacter caseinivorans]RKW70169.1 MFS transporter [Galactobacter caseinivorans]
MAVRALQPFRHQQYRVLALAMLISLFGHGLWAVSMVYQVRALGGGLLELSITTTALSIGLLACILIGGIAADRLPKHRILLAVEITDAITIGAIALLSLTGTLQLWHLVVVAGLVGASASFFFPAYSALLPGILPPQDLLAANGLEGTARPALSLAAGPALAGVIVAAASPGAALALLALCHVAASIVLTRLGPPQKATPLPDAAGSPASAGSRASALRDLAEGVRYTRRTPWLLWTLLFACVSVLTTVGPIEVLLPFVVSDQLGGDSTMFGGLLAVVGVGSMVGSIVTASRPLPRRYLTWMLAAWGLGSLPLILIGFTNQWWVVAVVGLGWGITGAMGQVIWGTLLQRRVPHHMLGRVSSLDFFVSLALMPVSMALAGPLATIMPMWVIFAIAAVVSPLVAAAAWWGGRLWRDEIDHPLDVGGEGREPVTTAAPES